MPIAKAALRDTPPVDVIYRGRSPGLRVIALVRLPEARLSDMMDFHSSLTVAGAAAASGYDQSPHRIPS